MSDSASTSSSAISLDDLVALNDEIGALVRAGVPLEIGLQGFAAQAPRRLADLSGRLADRMSDGTSLTDALEAQRHGLPRIYRFVVESGLRAGRLPQALESLSSYARSLLDVRRRIARSVIYPCIILIVAYYLFWYLVGGLTTTMVDLTTQAGKPVSAALSAVQTAHEAVEFVGHLPPIILGLLWLWWEASSRMLSSSGGIAGIGLRWIPGLSGIIRYFQLANFADLAAVMIDHDVPAAEAMTLAAETTGDGRMIDAADQIATAIGRGEPLSEALKSAPSFSPLMRWMIQTGARQDALSASLHQVSGIYHRRAVSRTERLTTWFPILVTLFVGGGAVLIYALAMFAPLTEMLKTIGAE